MEQMSSSHQEGGEASQAKTMDTMVSPDAGLALPAAAAPKRTAQDAGLPAEQSPPLAQEPRRPAFMPFDSQEAIDKAIEEAKIAHIHAGGTPTDYTEGQWTLYVKQQRQRYLKFTSDEGDL